MGGFFEGLADGIEKTSKVIKKGSKVNTTNSRIRKGEVAGPAMPKKVARKIAKKKQQGPPLPAHLDTKTEQAEEVKKILVKKLDRESKRIVKKLQAPSLPVQINRLADDIDRTTIGHFLGKGITSGSKAQKGTLAGPKIAVVKGPDPTELSVAEGKKLKSAALKILDQTTRPVHALAAGEDELLKGLKKGEVNWGKVGGRALKGLKNEDKTLFSDVLKHQGVPGEIAGPVGFGLDVAGDPTTYVSFGASSVAKNAVVKAATDTTKKLGVTQAKLAAAEAKGGVQTAATRSAREVKGALARAEKRATARGRSVTDKQREAITKDVEARFPRESGKGIVRQAEKKAEATSPSNRGLQVGFKGRKTSGKTSAAVLRKTGVSKATGKVRQSGVVQGLGQLLRPDFRPAGIAKGDWDAFRKAELGAASARNTAVKSAQRRAVAFDKNLSEADHVKVIDAIEAGGMKALSPELRRVAKQVKDDFKFLQRKERAAGIAGHGRDNYFPHVHSNVVEPGAKSPHPTRAADLGSSKSRKINKSLKQIRGETPGLFSEHVPLAVGHRSVSSAKGIADAEYLGSVAKLGRPLTKETKLLDGDAVYQVSPKRIRLVADKWGKVDKKEIDRALSGKADGGKYVVLNKKVGDRALKATTPRDDIAAKVGHVIDRRIQGPIKTVLTVPNPQYHFTNLYGDTFNAHLGDVKPTDLAQGVRAMRHVQRKNKAAKTLFEKPKASNASIKIRGKDQRYDDLIERAEKHGAIGGGFIGQELPALLDDAARTAEKVGKGRVASKAGKASRAVGKVHPIEKIRDASQYREDGVRFATFVRALKKGMSDSDAAKYVAKHHFDYGDLTEFERGTARRIMPFYTFTARNTPLQVEKLLSRPGKYANFQKVREEAAKATGIDENYESDLPSWSQRGVPIPVGKDSLLYPKLPLSDLNRLTANPGTQMEQGISQLSPLIKSPLELWANYNFFFKDKIASDEAPDVPAPDNLFGKGVGDLPSSIRDRFGIKKIRDKRSGKMIWAWPARVDYVAKLTPESSVALQIGTDAKNRQGQDAEIKALNYLTGLKFGDYDKPALTLNNTYEERENLMKARNALSQQDKKDSPEYEALKGKIKKANEKIYVLKKKRGDKVLPKTGKPKDPIDQIYSDVYSAAQPSKGKGDPLDEIYKEVYGK